MIIILKSSLGLLLDEANDFPFLTEEEEKEVVLKAQAGDKTARDYLINSNIKLVFSIAKLYHNDYLSLEDLTSEGIIGLIKATEKFELEKGYRFSTYAAWWIKQTISRAIENNGRTIRLPAYIMENVSKIKKAERELVIKLGKDPGFKELSEATGLSVSQIKEIKEYILEPTSLDMIVGDDEDATIGSLVEDKKFINPEISYLKESNLENLLNILSTLSERECDVLKKRFGIGLDSIMTLDEVGAEYGLTKERIRQIEAKALRKLRHPTRAKVLKYYLTD